MRLQPLKRRENHQVEDDAWMHRSTSTYKLVSVYRNYSNAPLDDLLLLQLMTINSILELSSFILHSLKH